MKQPVACKKYRLAAMADAVSMISGTSTRVGRRGKVNEESIDSVRGQQEEATLTEIQQLLKGRLGIGI